MKRLLLTVPVLVLVALLPRPAFAESLSITDNNSTLKFTRDDPTANLGTPADPVQLPRKIEWTVDGRRILVYPSSPATFVDVGHLHPGAHVRLNQIHAQGPLLDFATGPGQSDGTVTGGIVYSVDGGAAGSGTSRISEKVDIHNKTAGNVSVLLAGMGFKPTQASLEVPDLTGLEVTGTTLMFVHGNAQTDTFTEPPTFAPLTVMPVVAFSGFNPLLNQSLTLPAGAYLTMVTELKVARTAPVLTILAWLILAVIVLGTGAMLMRRRTPAR
jgi:hypothetical protein